MSWAIDLDAHQMLAAGHIGQHARLLAGPGTGKSHVLARRVVKLVVEHKVPPHQIMALVFTRVNAFDLRRTVDRELRALGITESPKIRTLHSFALEQLLKNSRLITTIPQPIRIADDYEEKEFIKGDLYKKLGLKNSKAADAKFLEVASDWQSLRADGVAYLPPDPAFLGEWQAHRGIYGYILRLELIWRLKQAMQEHPQFELETPSFLLVDEYQDLNKCDLQVIALMVQRGAELFCAGDDDQSIYGFRLAHPAGIRGFTGEYNPSEDFSLKTCWRCDKEIIKLAQFVANMDSERVEKPLEPREGAENGEVVLLRFDRETSEAAGVAAICDHLIKQEKYAPDDVLVLLRSDSNSLYSRILVDEFEKLGIITSVKADPKTPLDGGVGRYLLSLLRLHISHSDDLAWRTVLEKLRKNNGIGERSIAEIYNLATEQGVRFSEAIRALASNPDSLKCGGAVRRETAEIEKLLAGLHSDGQLEDEKNEANLEKHEVRALIVCEISALAEKISTDKDANTEAINYIQSKAENADIESYSELADALIGPEDTHEQELEHGVINILTMHRAKGLSAKAVFIIAAEEELLPGRSVGKDIGDQRRLLYVSLTRAKHRLYITHCSRRYNRQQHTGSKKGQAQRHLTPFLRDIPSHTLRRKEGDTYVKSLSSSAKVTD